MEATFKNTLKVDSKMKLQRQVAVKRGQKVYYKYSLHIPEELVKELGWKPGDEIEQNKKDDQLILKKQRK